MDGSIVTVLLRIYAGIDVDVNLDGGEPDQVIARIPILEFVFQNVTSGPHSIRVKDIVGFEEVSKILVTSPEGTLVVTFAELFSNPDKYADQDIVLEGFYFDGFETTVLSERLEYTGFAEGHLWLRGQMIWIENNAILKEIYNQFDQQQMTGPLERYGKLHIQGRFEHGGQFGHGGGFSSQIVPLEVELLKWSLPHTQ